MCAHFLSRLLLLYIGRVHGANSGCTDLGEVHPVSAQNKSLISDTVQPWFIHSQSFTYTYTVLIGQINHCEIIQDPVTITSRGNTSSSPLPQYCECN